MNPRWPPVEYMCVNHRCLHIAVAEEFLDSADIVAVFEEVDGEGVAKAMAADALLDAGLEHGFMDGSLNY
jgi:hypothetical protein